jgi:uncharacterized membrane protein YGL010W
MAPLFITIEVLMLAGFLQEFHKEVTPLINADRKKWNDEKKAAAAKGN